MKQWEFMNRYMHMYRKIIGISIYIQNNKTNTTNKHKNKMFDIFSKRP